MATWSIRLWDLNNQISGWLWNSWSSVLDWATQRQQYKDSKKEEAANKQAAQFQINSDTLLDNWLEATDPKTSQMYLSWCSLEELAAAMDNFYYRTRWKHINKTKYPNANAVVDHWRETFPTSEVHINNCLNQSVDLPTTLLRLWIALPGESSVSTSNPNSTPSESTPSNISYNPWNSRWSVFTPQDEEANDNMFWRFQSTSWWDVENEYKDSEHPYLEAFVDNFWKSFYNFTSDISDLVLNAWDVVETLGKTAVWIWANATNSDEYIQSMAEGKLKEFYEEANQMADWLWDYMIERWWWRDDNWNLNNVYDWLATIWNTFFSDPVWALDDALQLIEWWAWLTKNAAKAWIKNATKIWLKEWMIDSLKNISKWAENVEKIASAAAPSSALIHPIDTTKALWKNIWKWWNAIKKSKPWKVIWWVVNELSDYVSKSEKVKAFRRLADTKIGRMIFPEAQEIYKQLAPMTPTQIADFERKYGVKYGDYLNKYWIKWDPQEIVDVLQNINDWLYKQISDWVASMDKAIKPTWENIQSLRDMLKFDISHSAYVTSPNSEVTKQLVNIYNKFNSTWEISPAELLFSKRYFERKAKFTYWMNATTSAAEWEKATNIDNAMREMLIKHAEDNWYKWLRDMSKEIQRNRAIIDWVWTNAMKWYKNSALWLSDIILAASAYDEKALAKMALTWLIKSKWFKELQLDLWNKIRWIKPTKYTNVDMDEIRKVNAENRAKDWISAAFWDWTPRLTDNVQWWVVATDNMWWANMRYQDAIKDADKVIETYAYSPWDVEKNVYEWKDMSTNPSKFEQSSLFDSIVN